MENLEHLLNDVESNYRPINNQFLTLLQTKVKVSILNYNDKKQINMNNNFLDGLLWSYKWNCFKIAHTHVDATVRYSKTKLYRCH